MIRPLVQSLAGDRVDRVAGIVNGTTNFILSAMDETGADYADMLAEATRLGYAEADPTADVEGYDAAAKAAILASVAFHTRVTAADVYREGISKITAEDMETAKALGCTVKLLAICERVVADDGGERISVRVYPALVPRKHPLAAVNGAFNAVVVEAAAARQADVLRTGRGGAPTASAVMGDLVMAARNKFYGGRGPGESTYAKLPDPPIGDIPTRYHVNMHVADRPGVLAGVANEFSKREVSIVDGREAGAGTKAGDGRGRDWSSSHTPPRNPLSPRPLRRWAVWNVVHRSGQRNADWKARRNDQYSYTPCISAWPGLIEAYRGSADVGADWTPITLREGGTPLLAAARHLSELTGCRFISRSRVSTRPGPSRTAA